LIPSSSNGCGAKFDKAFAGYGAPDPIFILASVFSLSKGYTVSIASVKREVKVKTEKYFSESS
jgi:hypothetical protein